MLDEIEIRLQAPVISKTGLVLPEKRILHYQNKVKMSEVLSAFKKRHKIPYIKFAIFSFSCFRHTIYQQR